MDLSDFEFALSDDRRDLVSAKDPHRYVREADLALLYGTRERAVALIARAYIAFDLASVDCDEFMVPDTASQGRSN